MGVQLQGQSKPIGHDLLVTPSTRKPLEYTYMNSIGLAFPSNLSGTSGQNLFDHFTRRSSGTKARHLPHGGEHAKPVQRFPLIRLGINVPTDAQFEYVHPPPTGR
jgi:hypothetical protein